MGGLVCSISCQLACLWVRIHQATGGLLHHSENHDVWMQKLSFHAVDELGKTTPAEHSATPLDGVGDCLHWILDQTR